MKHEVMNDENMSELTESSVRITRARAKALGSSTGLPPLHPSSKQKGKQAFQVNLKRTSSDSKSSVSSTARPPHKKMAVLKDVTNVSCEHSCPSFINAARRKPSRRDTKGPLQNKRETEHPCFADSANVAGGVKTKAKGEEPQEICSTVNLITETTESAEENGLAAACLVPKYTDYSESISLITPSNKEKGKLCMKQGKLGDIEIIEIDSKHKDPQMCSLYAADIYSDLFARQVDRRPSADYMEKLQRDISQGMRGILVDWLVEVSEEYRLVPDTLYLTVNLIDRFLSENYIEKQNLQLLGITCMLIASKYEEICAPSVEEFCFITDNSYTKEEVVKMESHVLNLLGFQLSVPTTKKFLRRFIQAAQASYKVTSVELEFMANYLAELTLTKYSFLKFLPSLIAASAVFLAKWTLDQSDYPWNPTMEHYTGHKPYDLRTAVLELQELQLNTNACKFNAIRDKYKQSKFKSVSTRCSPKHVQSLF